MALELIARIVNYEMGGEVIVPDELPKRFTYGTNKIGLLLFSHRNQLRAGLGMFFFPSLSFQRHLSYPWVPEIVQRLLAFTEQHPFSCCGRAWWKYCWYELKDWVNLITGRAIHVPRDLWILRGIDGEWSVYADNDEGYGRDKDEETERVKEQCFRYTFDPNDNAYHPYEPPAQDFASMTALFSRALGSGACKC